MVLASLQVMKTCITTPFCKRPRRRHHQPAITSRKPPNPEKTRIEDNYRLTHSAVGRHIDWKMDIYSKIEIMDLVFPSWVSSSPGNLQST